MPPLRIKSLRNSKVRRCAYIRSPGTAVKFEFMEIINIEARTFEAMMARFETFADKVETLCRVNGDKTLKEWLDNEDVCRTFGLSLRTLQTYRDNGTLPFSRIGNKMYYKAEDLKRIIPLVANRKKKLNNPNTD